jgi:3-oxoacyl-[acyl-carrier-protein] synthase-1
VRPLSILASGLVTPLGLDAASTCAAIRCGIHAAAETTFVGPGGEPVIGCTVPIEEPLRGIDKLSKFAASAIRQCLPLALPAKPKDIPLLLGVAEPDRPGRLWGLDEELLPAIETRLSAKFDPKSRVLPRGRVAILDALRAAEALIYDEKAPFVLVAAVDTYLVAGTINAYLERNRLLTAENSDGFVPGEAAGALLVSRPRGKSPELVCWGGGEGVEEATIASDKPLRADGLAAAFRSALSNAGRTFEQVDYRIVDASGEQSGFKEAVLAIGRTIRKVKPEFPLWHPADCIGETGAAIGPCALAVALAAARKSYSPGPGVLCHFGTDDGARAALVLGYQEGHA